MDNNQTEDFFVWEEKNLIEPQMKSENNGEKDDDDITKVTKNVSNVKNENGIIGIYKIINKVNGKYYVGSSQNIKLRWQRHKSSLKHVKHWNVHLQNAYNKHGIDNFEYTIVEQLSDVNELLKVEQRYLNECKNSPDKNYMISYDATAPMRGRKAYWNVKGRTPWNKGLKTNTPSWNRGMKMSDEKKSKLREQANRQFTEEFRKKHSNYCKSQEHRDKISKAKLGKKRIHLGDQNKVVCANDLPKYISIGWKSGISQKFKNAVKDNAKLKPPSKVYLETSLTFKNLKTGETYTGSIYSWYIKYFHKLPNNLARFLRKEKKSLFGWIVLIDYQSFRISQ